MNSWWDSITTGLISGLITGMITCAIFYWLSGRDLAREAENLQRMTILILRALANAGLAEFNVDPSGKPIGLVIRVGASDGIKLEGSAIVEAAAEVIRGADAKSD